MALFPAAVKFPDQHFFQALETDVHVVAVPQAQFDGWGRFAGLSAETAQIDRILDEQSVPLLVQAVFQPRNFRFADIAESSDICTLIGLLEQPTV